MDHEHHKPMKSSRKPSGKMPQVPKHEMPQAMKQINPLKERQQKRARVEKRKR